MFVMRKVLPFYSFTGKRCVLASALGNSMHGPFSFTREKRGNTLEIKRRSKEAFCLAL